jgi:hypothetical protein
MYTLSNILVGALSGPSVTMWGAVSPIQVGLTKHRHPIIDMTPINTLDRTHHIPYLRAYLAPHRLFQPIAPVIFDNTSND